MDSSSYEFLSKSAHRRVRKLLARSYLNEARTAEALEVYTGLLRDDPDDAEVLIVLGNLYRLAGSPCTARRLYQQVIAAHPTHPVAQQQSALIEPSPESEWVEDAPLSPEAFGRLGARLERLMHSSRPEDMQAAAELVDNTLAARLFEQADSAVNNIQQLMPALVALNIRQARAAGHSELADALQSLQINLVRQVDERWVED